MFSETATYYDPEQKIWSGPKRKDYFGPDMTLGEVALQVLSKTPDKIVQVMDGTGEVLTAAELVRDAKAVATNLQHLGLKVGDVIGISANNTTNLTAVLLGALLCGTPTNALYPGFEKESVEIVFKVTKPKLIFCDAENFETIRAAVVSINLDADIIIVDGDIVGVRNVKELLRCEIEHESSTSFPCSKMSGDDTAVILCSSGTTGAPKGVLCSHRTLLNQPLCTNITLDAVVFTFSTMYWVSGLLIFTLAIINGLKRIITKVPFTPEYYIHLIERYRITHTIASPGYIAQMIQHATPDTRERLTSIDTIFCAGSKVPRIVADKMNAILGDEPRKGLVVAYGMSEIGTIVTGNDEGPGKRREGTEGKLSENKKVRILGKNGELLGVNETGLISILMPYKWLGYYNNPEATHKALVDGWLITSDIGYFDEDGYLTVCTRDSEIFKSNNFQIYPELIEEVIMELPGVLEACVFGVPELVASNLVACAVVRADNDDGIKLTEESITEYVALKMSAVHHIKGGVFFMETLPKTGSGKVQRRKVWEMIQNGK